jgi:hypothetical protein
VEYACGPAQTRANIGPLVVLVENLQTVDGAAPGREAVGLTVEAEQIPAVPGVQAIPDLRRRRLDGRIPVGSPEFG